MASLRLNLLGGFGLTGRSGEAITIARPRKRAQALLAYLACRPGQTHPRDQLAALLWPDTSDQQARAGLRRTLSALRAAVATHLRIDGDGVTLDATDIDIDVARLERLLRAGSPDALEEAAELYRGDLLEGLGVTEAPFEEWLGAERERLREAMLEGLARLLGVRMRAGNAAAALGTARRLIALDPLQEVVHRALMRLYAAAGRRDAALRQYQVCVDTLQRELGTEPEADTRRLYQEVLGGRESGGLAPPREPPPMPADPPKRGGLGCARELFVSETPAVGREAELVRLGEALDEAFAGRGQTMAIVGEAGIGKSRLLAEIGRRASERDGVVLLGRCYPTEVAIAYAPWVEAFRGGGVLADAGVRERLEPTWQAELARLFPELGPAGHAGPARPEDQVRLLDAVARLVQCLTASGPVALLLEDVHWADEMSVRLLSTLARRIARWPTLVVLTAREEDLGELPILRELLARPDLRQLRLAPLTRPEGAALVKAVSGNHLEATGTAEVVDRIWAGSAGNPFVIVETVRAIEQRAWAPDDALPLPDQVRSLIGARLDRLSTRGRQLTALSAVIGRQFSFELLEGASGAGADDTEAGVEEMVRRRVLRAVGEQFELVHDRLREFVYEELLPIRRKLLHRRVADALEALYGSGDDSHIGILAQHYHAGEVWDKAARYLHRAGAQTASRAAMREAVRLYEEAIASLRRLPETREALELAIDVRLDLRAALIPVGEMSRAAACLDEAERLARELGDVRRLGSVHVFQAQYLYFSGRSADALAAAQRAVAAARSLDDTGLSAVAEYVLGQASVMTGDYRGARACFNSVLGLLERAPSRQGIQIQGVNLGLGTGVPAVIRTWFMVLHAFMGEFDAGIRCGAEAIQMAEHMAQPYMLSFALLRLGELYCIKGDFDTAIEYLERGLEVSRSAGLSIHLATLVAYLGLAYAEAGAVEKGRALIEQSQRDSAALGLGFEANRILRLGTAALRASDPVEARALGERACALARADGERGNEAAALHLIGSAMSELASAGDHDHVFLDAADRHFVDALALADELGMRPLAARCHLGLGQLYARAGASERSANSLTTAVAMFRDMDMTYWRGQAESALRKPAASPAPRRRHV